MFSQRAIQEFKEAFGIMDADKVGNKKKSFSFLYQDETSDGFYRDP
jgi:hypothetical protein